MPRKSVQLTHLATRKRLLLAESEVNRAELGKELRELQKGFTHIKKQVRTASSIASTAAMLATAISLFRKPHASSHSNGAEKTSWITSALSGARLGTSLFLKIKSLFRE